MIKPSHTSRLLLLNFFFLHIYTVQSNAQALNGNYTIGGNNPNFPTFTSALQSLDSLGVSGPVTFWVRDGSYNETLFIDSVSGASQVNQITFRSESGDSNAVILNGLTNSVNTKSVWFYYASHIRLHQISVRQLPSVHNTAVIFVGRGNHITLSNCVLWGHGSSTSSGTEYVVQGACDTNLLIENCVIRGATEGIVSAGSNPVQQNPIFRGNHIFGVATRSIYLIGSAFGEISHNIIGSGGSSSSTGILLSGCSRTKIVGNRIRMISGIQGSPALRIISSSGWPNQYLLVTNNEISYDAYNNPVAYGIIASGDYHLYAHNSIRMSGGIYSTPINLQSTSYCKMYNNIFVNEGTGASNYPIDISVNTNFFESNNNNIYGAGPNFSPNISNLAAYQTATGRDSLSISVPPQFINSDTLIAQNPAVFDMGIPLPQVGVDINNQPRGNPSDLGAYETPSLPRVNLGNDTIACDSVRLSAPAQSGVQWLWSTGDTLPALVVRQTGLYWLQGTNNLGVRRDTVVVTILTRPQLQLSASSDSLCPGGCSQLSASVSGGSGAFAYQWQPASGLSNPLSAFTQACPTISTSYQLSLTDSAGCAVLIDSIYIYVVPPAQLSVSSSSSACAGDTLQLQSTSQWTNASYRWEPSAWMESPTQAQTRAWPPVGMNTVTLIVTHTNGCSDTAQVSVQLNPLPPQPQISSLGGVLYSSSSTGNQWYRNDTVLAGATADTLLPVINGLYRVEVTDALGCQSSSNPFTVINVGLFEGENDDVLVFPNPARDVLFVTLPGRISVVEPPRVYDALGQRVHMPSVVPYADGWILSTAHLQPGIYYITLMDANGRHFQLKWVKMRD
jgi:hypothetical protein